MQARYAIFRVLLEAGEGLLQLSGSGTTTHTNDIQICQHIYQHTTTAAQQHSSIPAYQHRSIDAEKLELRGTGTTTVSTGLLSSYQALSC